MQIGIRDEVFGRSFLGHLVNGDQNCLKEKLVKNGLEKSLEAL